MIEKYTNEHGKECFRGLDLDSAFDATLFHYVADRFENDAQLALHTNLGSITVLMRMTGFGWVDVETGYRDPDGVFWLASGQFDIRGHECKTFNDAIELIKKRANTCIAVSTKEEQKA